jgi:hypothetical protein
VTGRRDKADRAASTRGPPAPHFASRAKQVGTDLALFERSDENAVRQSRLTISALYDKVYADPANKAVVARAHRRPTASSTSGSELQRDDELKLAIASRVVVAA